MEKSFLAYLRNELLPPLLQQQRQRDRILRIWMTGQTSPEEPYLLAMLLTDLLETELAQWSIKIFATYRQEADVEAARGFVFSEQQLARLPATYQHRFFERVEAGSAEQGFRLALVKSVRQLVIFGSHDLLYHPPFPHLHLLIGLHALDPFSSAMQGVLLGRFAISLNAGGFLLLGPDTHAQPHPAVYDLVDETWQLYRCRALSSVNTRRQFKVPYGTAGSIFSGLSLSDQQQASTLISSSLFQGLGVLLLNHDSRILFLDMVAARLLGMPQEAVGQKVWQMISSLSEALLRTAIETVFAQHTPLMLTLTQQEPIAQGQSQPLTLLFAELAVSEGEQPLMALLVSEEKRLSSGLPPAQMKETPVETMASLDEQVGSMQETLHLVNAQLQNKVALLQTTLEQAEQLSVQLQVANEELQAFNEELEVTSEEVEAEKLEEETTSRELQVRLQEEIRTRQQLEELNRLKDSFISMASHEFKTPLTSILGNVQLALKHLSHLVSEGVEPPRDHRLLQQALERSQRHTRRLTRLVNDLLDVSLLQTHTLQVRFDRCDLTSLVYEMVDEQRQLTPDRQLALSLPEHPIEILADPDRIGQVVNNYLSNALKYTPHSQIVEVSLREEDQAVRLQVSDRGPGISLPEQERVWERFYQVPGISVQNGSATGLGLGLAISRFIIEKHGGKVGVESMPGQGTTFWFTLPTTKQEKED